MDKKNITTNARQTQKLGRIFAKEIINLPKQNSAVVIGLQGNLGGGKTTFLQGLAGGLGIGEKILSPTFVILKRFNNFYHIDCYRIKNEKDILELGWEKIISDPKNIVAVEWPEKIKKVLPKNTIYIKFTCPEPSRRVDKNKREISFKS